MDTQTCKDCAHFYQHYVLTEEQGIAVDCGHCYQRRLKHRKWDGKICDNFKLRNEPATAPNRRRIIKFLNTKVLEQILSLELPPEIADK